MMIAHGRQRDPAIAEQVIRLAVGMEILLVVHVTQVPVVSLAVLVLAIYEM